MGKLHNDQLETVQRVMNTKPLATIEVTLFENGYTSFTVNTEGKDEDELVGTDLHALIGALDVTKTALTTELMQALSRMQRNALEKLNEEIRERATEGAVSPKPSGEGGATQSPG